MNNVNGCSYLIGQRVILNRFEIGTVSKEQADVHQRRDEYVWVFSPSKGYASCYAAHNVQPLPGAQL